MPILDSLTSIRGIWISRVSHHLAREEGIRESFQEQLEIYYNQLIQCVASGNLTWLDPVVNEWVQAQTVSELEEKATSLSPIIDQFLQTTCSVARECLAPRALAAFSAAGPLAAVCPLVAQAASAETANSADAMRDIGCESL